MNQYKTDYLEEGEKLGYSPAFPNAIAIVLLVCMLFFIAGVLHFRNMSQDLDEKSTLVQKELEENKQQGLSLEKMESNLKDKESALNGREKELQQLESSLSKLVEIKGKIIAQLKAKLSETDLNYEFDRFTGTVRFDERDLFDSGRTALSNKGEKLLKKFVPAYGPILLGNEYKDYIDQIAIEVHSYDRNSYANNLDLSQRRAAAVAKFIIGGEMPDFTGDRNMTQYLAANGMSNSSPLLVDGVADKEKSRRVEFKFVLKESEFVDKVLEVLEGEGS